MKFLNRNKIVLERKLNEVDKFTFDFIKILEKYSDYVIISGYVAILLGRNRGTDDIDIIIPEIKKEKFSELCKELFSKKYWAINSPEIKELYGILTSGHSIRISIEPTISPNIEMKFSKNEFDAVSLNNQLIVEIEDMELKISSLELQIAYKEEVLKSNKDIEDAKHIREVAKTYLNEEIINNYKKRLRNAI
tara:strand:+ start:11042 stop:11617 length:576 start_codon:yes stop_codon:yes gene_type:complete